MRTNIRIVLALLAPIVGPGAIAGEPGSYPRIVGSGENASVEYGPGPLNNVVGGGRMVSAGSNDEYEVRYLDAEFVQLPRFGVVPVIRGGGENIDVVWVPAGNVGIMIAQGAGRN